MEHAHVKLRARYAGVAMPGLIVPLVALSALSACGASSSASHTDAGHKGARDAASRDGTEATTDATTDTATVLQHEAAVRRPACKGASDCSSGELCCDAVGGIGGAGCVKGSACPSGLAELCGTAGARCSAGTCQHVVCTVMTPHLVAPIIACGVPVLTNATCTTTPDASPGDGP